SGAATGDEEGEVAGVPAVSGDSDEVRDAADAVEVKGAAPPRATVIHAGNLGAAAGSEDGERGVVAAALASLNVDGTAGRGRVAVPDGESVIQGARGDV